MYVLKYKQLGVLCVCFLFTYIVNVFVYLLLYFVGISSSLNIRSVLLVKGPFNKF